MSIIVIDVLIIGGLLTGVALFRNTERARLGNSLCAVAVLAAVLVTVKEHSFREPTVLIFVLPIAATLAWYVATSVRMIQIPAMVAFQNGAGGMAAFLVSYAELARNVTLSPMSRSFGILSLVVGAITFSGSMIASGKLANILNQRPARVPRHGAVLGAVVVGTFLLGAGAIVETGPGALYVLASLLVVSLGLGVLLSMPVGGGDMPVWISFLNALSGLACAFCGIMTQNRPLIACGAMVGASGLILTLAMCRAMNRHLWKVLAGSRADRAPEITQAAEPQNHGDKCGPTSAPVEWHVDQPEGRDVLGHAVAAVRDANTIIIIPGYGTALAQAQFELVELASKLEAAGKDVAFAIHPVAGRMPGHMNVVLAEAGVDYAKLLELDPANSALENADLALVVGACDVVNPAAISTEGTPISGMPILLAQNAKQILVCNLDQKPGYSGVENPLYANPRTILLLGDAKSNLRRLLERLA